jgi:cytochrome d ubiquinol oxidase subunit II
MSAVSFFINYGVLAAFLVLFLIEVGMAFLAAINYDKFKGLIMPYIVPIWEINGTFAVFYVVNLEATYPSLVPAVGTLFVAPLIFAFVLYAVHNGFLAYSEFIEKKEPERIFMTIYGVATLIVAFVAVSMLTASVSAIGVSLKTLSITSYMFFLNGFNIMYFIAIFFLVLTITFILFNVKMVSKLLPLLFLVIALVFLFVPTYIYTRYIFNNFLHYYPIFIVVLLILVGSFLLYYLEKYPLVSKALLVLGSYASIMYFGGLEYPYFFNGAINASAATVSGPIGVAEDYITVIGGLSVVIFMVVFVYLSYFVKEGKIKKIRAGSTSK